MKQTTLCYILRGEECLLLHRNRKKEDGNDGKWMGIGGKFEENESPEDCVCREVLEETGLTLEDYTYRGLVTFVSDCYENEMMHLFTARGFSGELIACDEGDLVWRPFADLFTLPRWAGDDVFLGLLRENRPFFSLKLVYEGETLKQVWLDGRKGTTWQI